MANHNNHKEIILLIHGFPKSKKFWEAQVIHLSKEYECMAIDFPGYGENQTMANFTHSMDTYADFIFDHLHKNSMEHVDLLGVSMGGWITLNLLRRHPITAMTLTLIHTSFRPDTPLEKIYRNNVLSKISQGGLVDFIQSYATKLLSPSAATRLRHCYILDMLDTSKDSIVSGYKAIRDRPDESQNLKHFKVPVQLVIGSDDHSPSPDEALNISKEIPNATLVTMEKCGHAAPLEHPDRLNTLLSEWFKKKTGINPH